MTGSASGRRSSARRLAVGAVPLVIVIAVIGFWLGDRSPSDGSASPAGPSAAEGDRVDDALDGEGELGRSTDDGAREAGSLDLSLIEELPAADSIPEPRLRGPAPVSLRIPGLDLAAGSVRAVGVETNGELEVPGASEVGWYRFGSAPGQEGSTVLAAHIAFDGTDGVFRYLDEVALGTTVEVVLEDGSTLRYEIVEKATYDKVALPFDEIFDETGPDRLALITCGGEFNPELRSYESNVVAYAIPLS